jgi:GNAT superfamily N-acetyltransferase
VERNTVPESLPITLRPARKADLPTILELYAQPDFDDGTVLPLTEAESIFHTMHEYPDYTLHVAESDGQVIGSFALLVMHNLGHMGACSAIVEEVVVHPALQGKGVGRAMMQRAMDLARDKGCYKLVLSSNVKRERAHRFYERLGFRQQGFAFWVPLSDEDVGERNGGPDERP